MKRTIVFTVAGLLAAALTSCDSSDPVLSSEMSGEMAFAKTDCGGEIALNQSIPLRLIGPGVSSGSTTGAIKGTVQFGVGPSPILIRDMLSVSIKFDALVEVFDGTNRTWTFSGNSTDQIALGATDPGFFLRKYTAPGLTAQSPAMVLYVQYLVDGCNIAVNSMWAVEGGLRTSEK